MPSFVFFAVLFDSYEEILCLWHHPEVSSLFTQLWFGKEGSICFFFSFFFFCGSGHPIIWGKFGTMLRNYRTESFLGLSAILDFKKSSKIRKQQRHLSRRKTVAQKSPTEQTEWISWEQNICWMSSTGHTGKNSVVKTSMCT